MNDRDTKELAILTRNLMYKIGATRDDESGSVDGFLTIGEWAQLTGQSEGSWESVQRQMIVLGHHLDILPGRGYFLGDAGGPGRVMALRLKSAQTLLLNTQEIINSLQGVAHWEAIKGAMAQDLAKRGVTPKDVVAMVQAANQQLVSGAVDSEDGFSQLMLN